MIIAKLNRLTKWLRRRPQQRVIAILGMHRSGTSLLTGSLQQAGLELHRFHSENPHNRKGNRENPAIVDLNSKILEANGGRWDEPPATVHWQQSHVDEARRIIAEFADYPLWGFKDPRTLLTLQGWQALLPGLELVGIFRHPLAVASSLNARDMSFPIDKGLALWQHYNARLLRAWQEQPFPLLSFDRPADDFLADLERVALRLRLPQADKMCFYDPELVNQNVRTDRTEPGEDVMATYEQLQRCADASRCDG